ncbi:MAG: trypsin-like serine peptidase [Caulobacteraceae bacterium]
MLVDLSIYLMSATVQVAQPLPGGTRTVGTGFLVSDPSPDGQPRTVLVTAKHVFEGMPGTQATIGFRVQDADGEWRFAPEKIAIRQGGRELWTENPDHDVAVIAVKAPSAFARAAIPLTWIADDQDLTARGLEPGEVMMALGYPQGLSSNSAGFPILRSGRIASYPLAPSSEFPTFLLDFRVFPGNSGGPVYAADPDPKLGAGSGLEETSNEGLQANRSGPLVAGLLTQEVEYDHQNLGIGIVTEGRFIRDTLAQLDGPVLGMPPRLASASSPPTSGPSYSASVSARSRLSPRAANQAP